MNTPILVVKGLQKNFETKHGLLKAVDGISFRVDKGKTLGIVGESGCGKSTAGRSILRLTEPSGGQVIFEGVDITKLSSKEMRLKRKDMQIIFQDPFSSLDPRKTVSQIISEPILLNKLVKNKNECEKMVLDLMDTVGIARRWYNTYPHQMDGGRRQRIGIARALSLQPKLIICDEPVSALDVSIQAQIINLLKDLKEEMGLTYIFITHDLSVVYYFSDEIAVMYLGKIVEKAPAEDLFKNPLHPYTKALLSAVPIPNLGKRKDRIILSGEVSSPIDLPNICRFKNRCYDECDLCSGVEPELTEVKANHFVACYKYRSM